MKHHDKRIRLCHPQYMGFFVLEEARRMMLDTYYNKIKSIFKDTRMAYTDTDSLVLVFSGFDIYKLLETSGNPLEELFDTSNFKLDISKGDPSRKGRLGLLKSETKDIHISEFVCLQPKCYSILLGDGSKKSRCRGVTENEQAGMTHDDYLDVHNSIKFEYNVRNANIISVKNKLYTVVGEKRAFSKFDRKKFWITPEKSLSFGHPDIPITLDKSKNKRKYDQISRISRNDDYTQPTKVRCKNSFNQNVIELNNHILRNVKFHNND